MIAVAAAEPVYPLRVRVLGVVFLAVAVLGTLVGVIWGLAEPGAGAEGAALAAVEQWGLLLARA